MKEEFRRAVETVAAMAGGDAEEAGTPVAPEPNAELGRTVPLGRFGVFSTHARHDNLQAVGSCAVHRILHARTAR